MQQYKTVCLNLFFSSYSRYLFFGGLTTLVSLVLFLSFFRFCHLSAWASNLIAWWPSVVFAWWTNRLWVFDAPKRLPFWSLLKELSSFTLSRILTGILDVLLIGLTVDCLGWHDLLMKILVGVLIVVLNYLASKLIVFKKRTRASERTEA